MLRQIIIFLLSLSIVGCSPSTKYSTHEEFVSSRKVDPKKGWVQNVKASYEVEWEN